jgi:UDP-N-acetylmuramoyl-L-alanyl-D-glutamate--2,6-diaminopimelate ligase
MYLKLSDLLSSLPTKKILGGNREVEIQGLAYHSGSVKDGFLFAVIRGSREDGKRFVPEAISRGACALLVSEPLGTLNAVQVVVPDVREALATLSSAFYGNPSSFLTLIGITGTNGKTTTSYLIESILKEDGKNVGVMGTVNYRFQGRVLPAPTTTPESLDLQRNLHAMRESGVTHVILEVSSHSLDLQRVRGCDFDVALFTNLSRDHLDYHGSMEEYFRAKQLLFTRCLRESRKENHFSIINVDDPRGADLAQAACGTVLRYGFNPKCEVWPQRFEDGAEGLRFHIRTPRGILTGTSPLIGRHNLYNILAAVSVGEVLTLPHSNLAEGIAQLSRVPGRLERVPGDHGFGVFVDYAHTPDALERTLETLRAVRSGRLIVVFGCGGDRDRGKRAEMGKVAAQGSDLAVITSDNPRTEDPLRIIEEVEKGTRATGQKKYERSELADEWTGSGYVIIPDRREAIQSAIRVACPGDVVLIAGKGHEDYQVLGTRKIHFDDCEEAAEALALRGRKGDHESLGQRNCPGDSG